MGGVLSQLGQLFSQTLPTVIIVFILYAILRRWLFAPLIAVLK